MAIARFCKKILESNACQRNRVARKLKTTVANEKLLKLVKIFNKYEGSESENVEISSDMLQNNVFGNNCFCIAKRRGARLGRVNNNIYMVQ